MRKTNLVILTILLFLVLSCNKEKIPREGIHPIQIQNESVKKSAKVGHLFDLEIIPLQTTDSSLISSQTKKIQIIEDEIFIVDSKQQGQLFIFKKDGSFVRKIDLKIQDNAPISSNYQIQFYPDDKSLEIYDKKNREERLYTLEGDLLSRKSIPFEYNFKRRLNHHNIIYDYLGTSNLNWNIDSSDYNAYSILVLNQTAEPIANLRPYPPVGEHYRFYAPWDVFYTLGSSLHYYRPFCDTVFKLKAIHIEQKFLLNFTYNPHPRNLLFDPFINDKKAYCIKNEHPYLDQIFETARYLFVFYNYQNSTNFFAFDKIKNKAVINTQQLNFEKMDLQLPIPLTKGGNNQDLIQLISVKEIKPLLASSMKKGNLPWKYRKLLDRLKDTDNPVLIRYLLKA